MNAHELCKEKIESLQAIMIHETPKLPTVIGEIRRLLAKNPEVVTMLDEEDIGKLVAGMAVRANAKMTEMVAKTARTKKVAVASLSDLDI